MLIYDQDPVRVLSHLEGVFTARARQPGDEVWTPAGRPPSFGEWIANQLIAEIVSGEIPDLAPIREVELAARFRTSRAPIREAIALLSSYGLLVDNSRRSQAVKPMTPERVIAISEARLALDPYLARVTAERRTDENRRELEAVRTKLRQAVLDDDRFRFFALFPRLGRLRLQACQNEYLSAMYCATVHSVARLWFKSVQDAEPLQAKGARLDRLLQAQLDHDSDLAASLVEQSIRQTMERLQRQTDPDRAPNLDDVLPRALRGHEPARSLAAR